MVQQLYFQVEIQKNWKQYLKEIFIVFHTQDHCSTIFKSQETEETQMSKNRWIKEMWYIHTTEYYSALKAKEILSLAKTWMNPEDYTMKCISKLQKDKYCMILLYIKYLN